MHLEQLLLRRRPWCWSVDRGPRPRPAAVAAAAAAAASDSERMAIDLLGAALLLPGCVQSPCPVRAAAAALDLLCRASYYLALLLGSMLDAASSFLSTAVRACLSSQHTAQQRSQPEPSRVCGLLMLVGGGTNCLGCPWPWCRVCPSSDFSGSSPPLALAQNLAQTRPVCCLLAFGSEVRGVWQRARMAGFSLFSCRTAGMGNFINSSGR